MGSSESSLAVAERHVRKTEGRVARLAATVERLERAGHRWAAEEARKMQPLLRETLALAHAHLLVARAARDDAKAG